MARTSVLAILAVAMALVVAPRQAWSVTLPCAEDADCDTVGAACVSGSCSCGDGRVMTSDLTRCLEGASEWGAACSDAVQCVSRLLVGGACASAEVVTWSAPAEPAQDVCRCAEGYHYLRGQCWKSVGLGGACRRSENCFTNHDSESLTCAGGAGGSGGGGHCACAEGFYQREYSSCRRISTEFGQECGIAQDCQYADSDCTDRRCGCRQGYAFDKAAKACRPQPAPAPAPSAAPARQVVSAGAGLPRLLGRALAAEWWAAREDADDAAASSARPGLLHARQGLGRAAVSAASAASACSSDADCGAHAACQAGSCVCDRGYFRSAAEAAGQGCHPEVLQSCSQDAECTMKNAVCRKSSGVCSCKGGYVASEDKRLCRKMSRALEWSCLHDEQCGYFGPGAVCAAKRCRCSAATHWVQDQQYCWVSRGVGESCRGAADCSALGEGAECGGDGTAATAAAATACRCTAGFHAAADGRSCRRDAAGVGAQCEQDEDCVTPHTACAAAACACVRGYIRDAAGQGCVSGVGGPCSGDADCGAAASQCVDAQCSCPQGRVASLAGDACLEVVVALNGSCTESAQCSQINGSCSEGACACAAGQHFRDGQCHRKHVLGERCAASGQCFLAVAPERAECRNGLCRCAFDFLASEDGLRCSPAGRATLSTAAAALWLAVWLSLAGPW